MMAMRKQVDHQRKVKILQHLMVRDTAAAAKKQFESSRASRADHGHGMGPPADQLKSARKFKTDNISVLWLLRSLA